MTEQQFNITQIPTEIPSVQQAENVQVTADVTEGSPENIVGTELFEGFADTDLREKLPNLVDANPITDESKLEGIEDDGLRSLMTAGLPTTQMGSTEILYTDKNGNMSEKGNSFETASYRLSQEFPDPPIEEKKKAALEEMKRVRDERVNGLQTEADELIKQGKLSEKRRDRYISKQTDKIDEEYKQEQIKLDYDLTEEYRKKPEQYRNMNVWLRDSERKIRRIDRQIERFKRGDTTAINDLILKGVDTRYLDGDKKTREKGITTYNQFLNAFINGDVQEGDILQGYDFSGYGVDKEFGDRTKPVFYEAQTDKITGEKKAVFIADAYVDPVSGKILGSLPKDRKPELDRLVVDRDYSYTVNFNFFMDNLNQRLSNGEINQQQYDAYKNRAVSIARETREKNLSAYNELMNSADIPKELKFIIIASTFPDQFKEKANEFISKGEDKSLVENIVRGWGMFATAAPRLLEKGLGLISEGIYEGVQLVKGTEDVELKMGVLALELKKNPKLGSAIMNVLASAGNRKNIYLSSIEGMGELVKAAYMMIDSDVTKSDEGLLKKILPEYKQLSQDLVQLTKEFENEYSNYRNGFLKVLNSSTYTPAMKEAQDRYNEMVNNKDPKYQEVYKFLLLRKKISDTGINSLSEEEKSFMQERMKLPANISLISGKETGRAIVSDFIKENGETIARIVKDSELVAQAYEKAKSLFPKEAIAQYEAEYGAPLMAKMDNLNRFRQSLMNSKIFDKNFAFVLNKYQDLNTKFKTPTNVASTYIFPILSHEGLTPTPPSTLGIINPVFGFVTDIFNTTAYIYRSASKTWGQITNPIWEETDYNQKYLSSSIQEYKRRIENQWVDTGNAVSDVFAKIGGALPHMVGFSAASITGGPAGGAAYLAMTGIGNYMQEAANAGFEMDGQIAYALLATSIEMLSEQITKETAFLKGNKSKSFITKELVKRFMISGSRKEAAREIVGNIFRYARTTGVRGFLESMEEHVADKLTYMFETYMDNAHNTSFNPSMMSVKESLENLFVMIGTGAIFSAGTNRFMSKDPAKSLKIAQRSFAEQEGVSEKEANILPVVSTNEGLANAIEMVRQVESGEIASSQIKQAEYEYLRDVAIPAAMKFSFAQFPNASIQQRVVAMSNMMKINQLEEQAQNGEISAENAKTGIEQYSKNADRALTDNAYAEEQFGMTNGEMADMLTEYFGMADIAMNQETGIGIQPQQTAVQPPTPVQATVMDKTALSQRLSDILLPSIKSESNKKTQQKAINEKPEDILAFEIQNTKNLLEIAKDKYEAAAALGTAVPDRMKVQDLTEKLENLEALKQEYNNSQLYAINTSEREGQAINQQGGLVQYPGAQEGQLEEGQGEGSRREETQRSADYRNRNFSGQAQTAFQEITALPDQPPILQTYAGSVQPGQEVALMDEIASQVAIDEPAAIRQFGQPIVDRVKQYMGETGFTTNLPVVSRVRETIADNNVSNSKQMVLDAVNAISNAQNKASKSAVNTLVKQLQKAFPTVGVVMDKKGFNEAMQDEAARDLSTKGGVVYGRMKDGIVYLNPDFLNYNTPIHEFGHVWLNVSSFMFPKVYEKGLELIRDSEYMKSVVEDPLYANLSGEARENEALATAIGDRGEQFVLEAQKQGFRNWVKRMVRKLAQFAGIFNMSDSQLDGLTLDTYLNMASASLLGGQQITEGVVGGEGMMAKPGTFVDEKQRIINDMLSRMTLPATKIDYMLTIASGMFEHLNLANRQQTIDNLRSFYPELDVQRLEELARKYHPFAFKAEGEFMAKKDPVGEALKVLTQRYMDSNIARGMTIGEARKRAKEDAEAYARENIKNFQRYTLSKENTNSFIDDALDEIEFNELEKQDQRNRETAIAFSLSTPQGQSLVESVNAAAQALVESNKGKKTDKISAKDAYEQILENTKKQIESMYAKKDYPKGISELEMMGLAPAIANDAVMSAFNLTKSIIDGNVIFSTSELISKSVYNELAKTIKDVSAKAGLIENTLKFVFDKMKNAFGRGIQFSPAKVKNITSTLNDYMLSRVDVATSINEATNAITKIVEQEYKDLLTSKTEDLLGKLKSRLEKGDIGTKFMREKILADLLSIKPKEWINSTATLEDISLFNHHIRTILDGDLAYIDAAINVAGNIQIENNQRVQNEYKSIINKINNSTKKILDGKVEFSDYGDLLSIQKTIEDIDKKIGEASGLTEKQQAKIKEKYKELLNALPSDTTIDRMIAAKEADIKKQTTDKISEVKNDLANDNSKIRAGLRNNFSYYQFIRLTESLTNEYINSLSPKEMLALSNVLDNVMLFGNYNNRAYEQYVKAMFFNVSRNTKGWAKNLSAKRDKLLSGGLTNKFKDMMTTILNVEGGIPNPETIKSNLSNIRIHLMDIELNDPEQRDQFEMGFIEREILGPMAMAIDSASTKAQAELEDLREAMTLFSSEENYDVIKKAMGLVSREYGTNPLLKAFISRARRKYSSNIFSNISVKMAAIVAHQIDHISNLKEGEAETDIILKRNIFESWKDYDGVSKMFEHYIKPGNIRRFQSEMEDIEKMEDIIAYAALTAGGKRTLAGLKEPELMSLLTEKQREGVAMWRKHISKTQDLVEHAMITKGNMKALIKNYFPRRVQSQNLVSKIEDADAYLNGQGENIGLRDGQLQERIGNTGRIDLNGNRILYNNMKMLYLLSEVKPYLDYIKGIDNASSELVNEDNAFASVFSEGLSLSIKERLNANLLMNDRSINNNFDLIFRAVSSLQAFSAKMWLISVTRQLVADYPANIAKLSLALAGANRKFMNQTLQLIYKKKLSFKTDNGRFYWDDYLKIANFTGSPIVRTMSMYSDNFLWEFRKSAEQMQKEQDVASWQDLRIKKLGWMSKFEDAFEKITGEVFDHDAFADERGSYRAVNLRAVEKASSVADSFIDRQFGLSSFTRQNLRASFIFPFVGRGLRNIVNKFYKEKTPLFTLEKNSIGSLVTGFLQGYPTTQFNLFTGYMKQAFSMTSGLSFAKRAEYLSRGIGEAMVPALLYTFSRKFAGVMFTTTAAAIMASGEDEEKKEQMFLESENKDFWDKFMYKVKLRMKSAEDEILYDLANAGLSSAIDPQTSFTLRMAAGIISFYWFKESAVKELNRGDLSKQKRKEIKNKIRETETMLFNTYNIRPIDIFGDKSYQEAITWHFAAGEATESWENLAMLMTGSQAVIDVISNFKTSINLFVESKDNPNLSKDELYIATLMQAYGVVFANMILGGKFGPYLSMVSGDFTKFSKAMLRDLESEHENYMRSSGKKKGYWMRIYRKPSTGGGGKKRVGGLPGEGGSSGRLPGEGGSGSYRP